MTKTAENIVLGSPLTIHAPYSVECLLNSQHALHFSTSRFITHCNLLNPATLFLLPDSTPQNCLTPDPRT